MNTNNQLNEAAEDVMERLLQLKSPRDAISVLITVHVKLTLDYSEVSTEKSLNAYVAAFREIIAG